MASRSRKHRGMKTQALVAEYLKTHGWPFAESTGAARQGADVTGTVDIAVEVKARTNFEPLATMRQMRSNAHGRLPFAVLRCNGQGPESIEDWPAMLPFGVLVQLLREAGYGDGDLVDASTRRALLSRVQLSTGLDGSVYVTRRPASDNPKMAHAFVPSRLVIDGQQACSQCMRPSSEHYDPEQALA